MLEWHDVLMLKPTAPGSGFDTAGLERLPPGTVDLEDGRAYLVAVHHLAPDTADNMAALTAKTIADAVRSIGGEVLASLISDRSENGFARLPVREGECVVVTLIRPVVSQAVPALEAALREISASSGRVPDVARLIPTARSLLR